MKIVIISALQDNLLLNISLKDYKLEGRRRQDSVRSRPLWLRARSRECSHTSVWGLFVPGLFLPLSYKMLGINNLASKIFQQSSFYLKNVELIYPAPT